MIFKFRPFHSRVPRYNEKKCGAYEMNTVITQAEQNLSLLKSLIPMGDSFHIWCYGNKGKLLGSSCHGVRVVS
jgi:hypothetical protein